MHMQLCALNHPYRLDARTTQSSSTHPYTRDLWRAMKIFRFPAAAAVALLIEREPETPTTVPEPATVTLVSLGGLMGSAARWRARRQYW
jgi:hypothetical protein